MEWAAAGAGAFLLFVSAPICFVLWRDGRKITAEDRRAAADLERVLHPYSSGLVPSGDGWWDRWAKPGVPSPSEAPCRGCAIGLHSTCDAVCDCDCPWPWPVTQPRGRHANMGR